MRKPVGTQLLKFHFSRLNIDDFSPPPEAMVKSKPLPVFNRTLYLLIPLSRLPKKTLMGKNLSER